MGSARFKLDKSDLLSLLRGLGDVTTGAILTYLGEWVASTDFGDWTPLVVAGFSLVSKFVRKWLKDNVDIQG